MSFWFTRAMVRIALIGLLSAGVALGAGSIALAQDDPDYVSCGFFSTQAEAQEYLETRGTVRDNVIMDPDGNGIACEGAFPFEPMPVTLPNTGAGSSPSHTDRALLLLAGGLMASALVIRARGLLDRSAIRTHTR